MPQPDHHAGKSHCFHQYVDDRAFTCTYACARKRAFCYRRACEKRADNRCINMLVETRNYLFLLIFLLSLGSTFAHAQQYPTKPVRAILPVSPHVRSRRLKALAVTSIKEFEAFIRNEIAKWAKVIRAAKITIN